jgi:phenylacetic acid degradation operon negative regulatory protein
MVTRDGTVSTADLIPVAESCGQSADQVRSCIRRLVADGQLARVEHQRGVYRITERASRALGTNLDRARLAYAQDTAGQGWDHHWHLVAFAIPERRRASRDDLREGLRELGGAAIQGGLYVSPHAWEPDVANLAADLGISDQITLAATDELSVGAVHDPRGIAAKLWPVAELADRYRDFVATFGWVLESLEGLRRKRVRLGDATFLPGALAMGVQFQNTFDDDPLLPPELLPRPWPGRAARDLVMKSRRLALQLRETQERPALFHFFDEALARLL